MAESCAADHAIFRLNGTLELTLDIIEDCAKAYREASPTIKKLMNQAIFQQFKIYNKSSDNPQIECSFEPPFDSLIGPIKDDIVSINKKASLGDVRLKKAKDHIHQSSGYGLDAVGDSTNTLSHSKFFSRKSLSKELLSMWYEKDRFAFLIDGFELL